MKLATLIALIPMIALSGTATAETQTQGKSLQGMSMQGKSLQGISMQGKSLQGMSMQGKSLQGMSMQGRNSQGATPAVPQAGSTGLNTKAVHVIGGQLYF